MRLRLRLVGLVLLAVFSAACQAAPPAATQQPTAQPSAVPDCPPSLSCTVDPPAYVDAAKDGSGNFYGDGTYNYTLVNKAGDPRPIYGLVLHTTESSTESVVDMSHQPHARSSWNYLVKPNGSVEQSVPLNAVAYDSANRYFNTGYLQIEIVGFAGICGDSTDPNQPSGITDEQYRSLGVLGSYLAQRFGFQPNAATVMGHDNVPGISDSVQLIQHWDPGVCFDWPRLLASMGAPAVQHNNVEQVAAVTVTPPFKQNPQPLSGCTDGSQCDPVRAEQYGLNFATVYSQPSEQSPLVSDPYVHQQGGAGSTAMNDWGSKAPYGYTFAVAKQTPGWTGVWFAGQVGWIQNKFLAPANQPLTLATPKSGSVTVYGRPMPSQAEFDASGLPGPVLQSQAVPAELTRYAFGPDQSYPVAPVQVVNAHYAGCDKTDCSAPGDGTIVSGKDKYLMIFYGHRFGFVKADDILTSGQ